MKKYGKRRKIPSSGRLFEAPRKASRPEDVQEILRRIPDKAEFNAQLQRLRQGLKTS